jgi:hypothetical protein
VHFFDADGLACKDRAEVNLFATETDPAAIGDDNGLVVERIVDVRQSRVGAGRGLIDFGRVSFASKANLLASAVELAGFGVTVKQVTCFRKVVGATGEQGVALDFSEPLEPNILTELVTHLDYLGIPKHEISQRRLAEPEEIEAIIATQLARGPAGPNRTAAHSKNGDISLGRS